MPSEPSGRRESGWLRSRCLGRPYPVRPRSFRPLIPTATVPKPGGLIPRSGALGSRMPAANLGLADSPARFEAIVGACALLDLGRDRSDPAARLVDRRCPLDNSRGQASTPLAGGVQLTEGWLGTGLGRFPPARRCRRCRSWQRSEAAMAARRTPLQRMAARKRRLASLASTGRPRARDARLLLIEKPRSGACQSRSGLGAGAAETRWNRRRRGCAAPGLVDVPRRTRVRGPCGPITRACAG